MTTKTTLIAGAITMSLATIAGAQAPKAPAAPAAKPAAAPVAPATPAVSATPAPAAPAVSGHKMIAPKDVVWGPTPPTLPPGAKFALIQGDPKAAGALFTFRLEMPANYVVPPHFHPGDEQVTVISGNFSMGMGDTVDKKTAMSLPAGSYMIMPKGEHHYGFSKGKTVIQVHAMGPWGITYVNPADDPRNKATPAAAPVAAPATKK